VRGREGLVQVEVTDVEAEITGIRFAPDLTVLREHTAASGETGDTSQWTVPAQRERGLFAARAHQQAEQTRWLSEQLLQIQWRSPWQTRFTIMS